ncbi:unnamed protein product, partial [Ixodes persulcatus]
GHVGGVPGALCRRPPPRQPTAVWNPGSGRQQRVSADTRQPPPAVRCRSRLCLLCEPPSLSSPVYGPVWRPEKSADLEPQGFTSQLRFVAEP